MKEVRKSELTTEVGGIQVSVTATIGGYDDGHAKTALHISLCGNVYDGEGNPVADHPVSVMADGDAELRATYKALQLAVQALVSLEPRLVTDDLAEAYGKLGFEQSKA